MNRRGFLNSILAAGMAPAVVKAEILMPVRKLILPSSNVKLLNQNSLFGKELNPMYFGGACWNPELLLKFENTLKLKSSPIAGALKRPGQRCVAHSTLTQQVREAQRYG